MPSKKEVQHALTMIEVQSGCNPKGILNAVLDAMKVLGDRHVMVLLGLTKVTDLVGLYPMSGEEMTLYKDVDNWIRENLLCPKCKKGLSWKHWESGYSGDHLVCPDDHFWSIPAYRRSCYGE